MEKVVIAGKLNVLEFLPKDKIEKTLPTTSY